MKTIYFCLYYPNRTKKRTFAIVFCLTYGAVAVPILHEFKAQQVHDIVNHSEAKILFAGDMVWPDLNADEMPHLEGVINIPDYSLLLSRTDLLTQARERLNELFGRKFPKYFRKEHISYTHTAEDGNALALINYTSGTTSNSNDMPYMCAKGNIEITWSPRLTCFLPITSIAN